MPAGFLLIDGYNLLHAAGMARETYGPGDLQKCRARLLKYLLIKLTAAERDRTTLIFDARDPPPDRPHRFLVSGINVIFANPGGDADEVIEGLIADHSGPKNLTLISSDHRLQSAARRRRAKFEDSEQFFDRLERRKATAESVARQEEDLKKTGNSATSAAETAHWMKVFGELPELLAPPATKPKATAELPAATQKTKKAGRSPADLEKEKRDAEELENLLRELNTPQRKKKPEK